MKESGLLQAADKVVKLYKVMVEQSTSDPQTAMLAIMSLTTAINELATEVQKGRELIGQFQGMLGGLGPIPNHAHVPEATIRSIPSQTNPASTLEAMAKMKPEEMVSELINKHFPHLKKEQAKCSKDSSQASTTSSNLAGSQTASKTTEE